MNGTNVVGVMVGASPPTPALSLKGEGDRFSSWRSRIRGQQSNPRSKFQCIQVVSVMVAPSPHPTLSLQGEGDRLSL
jgi:hypothetical protein